MQEKDKKPKSRFKKRLLITLAAVFSIFLCTCITVAILFKQVPESYVPSAPPEPNSPIPLSIAATIYNGSQLAKPFDLVVGQDEINSIITNEEVTGLAWPVEINGVTISLPAITFQPDTLSVMATINFMDIPFVATLIAEPKLEADGMLYLNIRKVKAGTLDITPLASMLASGIFANQSEEFPDDPFIAILTAACLENKPIEPVFPAFDEDIRIISTDIQTEKLILGCKRESLKN